MSQGAVGGPGHARIGVLISGRGSNLRALLDATERGDVPADVVLVASNRPEAPGLAFARERAIPVFVADRQRFRNRAARQDRIRAALDAAAVDLVVLAGWDEILAPPFIAAFAGRLLNVHPSLLPAFGKTLNAQAEALEHGVKVSGCTVHFVTDDVDGGPIVLQRAVPVEEDDTVATLAARILAEEHRALPEAVRLWCMGRLRVDGHRVHILPADRHSTRTQPADGQSPEGTSYR